MRSPRPRPGARWRSACSPSGASARSSRAACPARGSHAVRLLRGPADGQRAPRRAPRPLARVQGHLPPLPDHARALRRPARRAGTATACRWRSRWRSASASRGKPEIEAYGIAEFNAHLPRVGRGATSTSGSASPSASASGSTPTGPTAPWTAPTSRASGGASPSCTGAACSTASDKVVPYCPRCGTALSSHEVALGYRTWTTPRSTSRFPLARRARRVAARLDHHALDAAVQPGRRDQPGRALRGRRARRGDPDPGRAAGARGARRGRPDPAHDGRRRARRARVRAPVPVHAGRPPRGGGRLRDHRGRHRDRPHRPGLRGGRHGHRARPRPGRPQPGGPGRAVLRRWWRRGPGAR